MGKLFIGGISPNSSGDTIRAHFTAFGAVSDVVLMRDRGFGFVTFEEQEAADAALAEPKQTVDGQVIDVKPSQTKGGGRGGGGPPGGGGPGAGITTDKVFIGGLPQDCSEDTFRDYFERYGKIVDAVVMKDRETGRSRGFGFVQYDTPDAVDKVMLEYSSHKIEGKWVEVKRSVPRDNMPSGPGAGRGGPSRDGGYGPCVPAAGYPGYCGYGCGGCGYAGYPGFAGFGGYPGYCGYGMPPPGGMYYGQAQAQAYAGCGSSSGTSRPEGRGGRSAPY